MIDNLLNREEQNLDMFFEKLDKMDTPVPDELEGRIRERITGIKARRNLFIKTTAAIAALLLIFIISLQVFPGFKAYAEGLPILGEALKWFKGDIGKEELNSIFKNAEGAVVRPKDMPVQTKALAKDEIEMLSNACSDALKVPYDVGYNVPSPEVIPFPNYIIDIKLKDAEISIQWDSVSSSGSYFQVIPLPENANMKKYLVFQKSNKLWDTLKTLMPVEYPSSTDEMDALLKTASMKVIEGKGSQASLAEVPSGPNKILQIARLLKEAVPTDEKAGLKPMEEYPIVLEFLSDSGVKRVYIMENEFIYEGKVYKSDVIRLRITRAILDQPYD